MKVNNLIIIKSDVRKIKTFDGIRVTFQNIPLKDIIVLSGERNINQYRKDYPNEFIIDVADLNGNYHLKYKKTEILIQNGQLFINGKKEDEYSIIIDNNEKILFGAFINHWEIPIDKMTEKDKRQLEEQLKAYN